MSDDTVDVLKDRAKDAAGKAKSLFGGVAKKAKEAADKAKESAAANKAAK